MAFIVNSYLHFCAVVTYKRFYRILQFFKQISTTTQYWVDLGVMATKCDRYYEFHVADHQAIFYRHVFYITDTHTHTHTHIYIHIYIYIYIYIYMCVCVCVCVCVYLYFTTPFLHPDYFHIALSYIYRVRWGYCQGAERKQEWELGNALCRGKKYMVRFLCLKTYQI